MITIGILGGVASGKSLVAARLAELGAVLLDADKAGHAVLLEDDVKAAIRERFGDDVFDEAGEVIRQRVAEIVFTDTDAGRQALADLEAISHPRIRQALEAEIDQHDQAGAKAVVLDAPVMLKSGWDEFCDYILYVDSPRIQRLARAVDRGWTAEEFQAREAAQESLETKRAASTHTIANDGSVEDTWQHVDAFWQSLM